MIKRLQRKFIAVTMVSLLLVIVLVLGAVNVANVYHTNQRADELLTMLAENDGGFPTQKKEMGERVAGDDEKIPAPLPEPNHRPVRFSAETPFETRYFIVRMDQQQKITEIDTGHIAAITDAEARQYARDVAESGKEKGYSGRYRFLSVEQEDGGLLLIFVDCRNQIETALNFFRNSCAIALVSLAIVLFLVAAVSRRVIWPVVESMEKQKLFITGAGHEIKTPLAIISANTDVIEMTGGESQWTVSIHNQVERLNGLVKNLLTLAKMEEGSIHLTLSELDYSALVNETVWAFIPLAEKKELKIEMEVQPDVVVKGDQEVLAHLVAILADNAVKYADVGESIRVALYQRGKACILEMENTCSLLPEGNLSQLFDRFYRGEQSRSRESGGYGIGLSVAQAIVEAHRGKISAKRKGENGVVFTVELNR